MSKHLFKFKVYCNASMSTVLKYAYSQNSCLLNLFKKKFYTTVCNPKIFMCSI